MKASQKADLSALLRQMRHAADAFATSARTLGVEALIDLANRTLIYVEACKARLERDEDFSDWRPVGELYTRLNETEAALAREQVMHQQTRNRLRALEPLEQNFRAQAYRVVQDDLQRNRLWIATENGDWLLPTDSGTLIDSFEYAMESRRAAKAEQARGSLSNPQPAPQPPPTLTHSPQDFRAPARRDSSIPPPPAMPSFDLPASAPPEPDPAPASCPDPSPDPGGGGDWGGGGGDTSGGGASGDW